MRHLAALIALAAAFGAAAEPVAVTTAPLQRVELHESVRAYGRVDQRPQYLYFEISGYLESLDADVGDEVTAGQVLARLDTRDVENELRLTEEALEHARLKYEQFRELSSQQAASRDQLEDRRYALAQRRLELEHLKEHRARHELRAPAAGRIVDRLVDFPGPVAADTPLFWLQSDEQPTLVSAWLSQEEVRRVAIENTARVILPEEPNTPLSARVHKIHPGTADSGLFEVVIALDALPDGVTLTPGMQVDVVIDSATRHRGYAVPVNALLSIDGGNGRLFVVEDGRAKALRVALSRIESGRVLLKMDLSDYQSVIVQGQHRVADGAAVRTSE
ncbi:MAG: efflux RND transporter periplasmic adaptor subunit [Pseudomonadota bacterium]